MTRTNGFRPQELRRRVFQGVMAEAVDRHAARIHSQGEVLVELSLRLDNLERRQQSFEQQPLWARLKWVFGR